MSEVYSTFYILGEIYVIHRSPQDTGFITKVYLYINRNWLCESLLSIRDGKRESDGALFRPKPNKDGRENFL